MILWPARIWLYLLLARHASQNWQSTAHSLVGTGVSSAPSKPNMALVLDSYGSLDNLASLLHVPSQREAVAHYWVTLNKWTSMLHGFPRMLGCFPHLETFIPAALTFNQRNAFPSKKHFSLVYPRRIWETSSNSALLTQAVHSTHLEVLWNIPLPQIINLSEVGLEQIQVILLCCQCWGPWI